MMPLDYHWNTMHLFFRDLFFFLRDMILLLAWAYLGKRSKPENKNRIR